MHAYDYSALLGLIKENKLTQESLSEKVGINKTTLNLKLNNNGEFTQKQMLAIMETLGRSVKDIPTYFFAK